MTAETDERFPGAWAGVLLLVGRRRRRLSTRRWECCWQPWGGELRHGMRSRTPSTSIRRPRMRSATCAHSRLSSAPRSPVTVCPAAGELDSRSRTARNNLRWRTRPARMGSRRTGISSDRRRREQPLQHGSGLLRRPALTRGRPGVRHKPSTPSVARAGPPGGRRGPNPPRMTARGTSQTDDDHGR